MPHLFFYTPICVVFFTFICCFNPKLQWSIGRANCLYYSTRVDLYSHQIQLKFYARVISHLYGFNLMACFTNELSFCHSFSVLSLLSFTPMDIKYQDEISHLNRNKQRTENVVKGKAHCRQTHVSKRSAHNETIWTFGIHNQHRVYPLIDKNVEWVWRSYS